jgi:hypothetical protein
MNTIAPVHRAEYCYRYRIRLFTHLAIPGWTTNVLGFSLLIGLQGVMLPLSMAFMLLNGRAVLQLSLKDFASGFISKSRVLGAETSTK